MREFRLQVKKSLPFFKAIIEKFYDNSRILLVGDLSKVDFSAIVDSYQFQDTESIPHEDCIIFTLTTVNKDVLLGLLPRIGIRHRVHQIFIEQEGFIVYVSNDSFYKD